MHVLLLRPVPVNERFGLGPFFRIEPLGMAYIAAALERQGHTATIADLRFSRSVEHYLRTERARPRRHRRHARARNRQRHRACGESASRLARRADSDRRSYGIGLPRAVSHLRRDRRRRRRWRTRGAAGRRGPRTPAAAGERPRPRDARRRRSPSRAPPVRSGPSSSTTCRGRRGAWWTAGAASTRVWRTGPSG